MIKLEHVVLASPEQMEFIIEGMRNPMNSWEKSDSVTVTDGEYSDILGNLGPAVGVENMFDLGDNDRSLMQRLANAGTDHRKFMRMMPVYVRITAPLYWWKEFDTYKVGTVANGCSTMHKIAAKEFTLDDFSCEHLMDCRWLPMYAPTEYCFSSIDLLKLEIDVLNRYREKYIKMIDDAGSYKGMTKKDIWWQMIQLLPSSYNQTRNVMLNYEVLANIYNSRKNHKLDEWRDFCKWIEGLPYGELIVGENFNPHNTVVGKRLDAGFTD
jgi:hypothetical protein|nr:MAG TPA: hypothetical protein [Caudoviricetes sp.]